ncbi:MAG: cell wall-binding repeat-containing protein [Acidimicrobiaceae bacterium]|nr:cell wall-binding repeat-containing protein [Acidimicrobiaceae bacterium]
MRRLVVIVLAALLALSGVHVLAATPAAAAEHDVAGDVPAGTGDGGSDVSITRYGGADRYETSLLIAEAVAEEAGGSLDWVILVSGERWTDAVVAAPLAGARNAPVLMTPPHKLRDDALAFLKRVGVSRAMVVGPDASGGVHGPGRGVAESVLADLVAAGIEPQRVAGVDRYHTSRAVAARYGPRSMGDLGSTAIVASGEVFADALVAGPFAARGSHPVLLTPPDELYPDIADYLVSVGIAHVVLMGGTAALSETVEQSIKDLGIDVSRVAGSTRYDTAVKAAELAHGRYSDTAGKPCFDTATIGVARARVPFDSFSAAPLLGRLCAPLVLADPGRVPADTAGFLDTARESHDALGLHVFGGDAAVSGAAIDAYLAGEDPDASKDDEAKDDEAGGDEPIAAPGVLPTGTCGGAIDDDPVQLVPSTAAEDPAWSPDCSRLVYTDNASLWTVNNDGTGARKLINHDGAYLHSAVWSPDGTRIAYVRGRNDENGHWSSHIWTVNVDGSHNNQRTEGDQIDRWPTWSPDGKWIAFERLIGSGRDQHGHLLDSDRHIVVMTSFGNKPRALNEGGSWEQSPAWSPDGSQLAFHRDGFLMVSDIDGGNAQRVLAGVYIEGGLSWSPDGTRIAFVRGDGATTSVVISDIDGTAEEVVFDEGIRTLAPRWSPDAQRIAFHTIDGEGKHRSYVAGAIGEPAGVAVDCRPRGIGGITAGFPLPRWSPSAVGTVRIGVLFMDFPDAPAAHSTEEEAALGLPRAEEYLEAASYGNLDIEFVPLHRWLRAEQGYAEYMGPTAVENAEALVVVASAHAVALADDDVDFSTLDMVLTVFPGSRFSGGNATGQATADEVTISTTRVNTNPLEESREPTEWGLLGAHEIAHNLGLLDMYPYVFEPDALPELGGDEVWASVDMGLMGLGARFRTHSTDARLQLVWRFPDGNTSHSTLAHFELMEMLGWSRWQLGWLDPSQVHCDSGAGASVSLSPISQPGDAVALAVVPLTSHNVIVVESRRAVGYDTGTEWFDPTTRARATVPGLVSEGVLVYTVDTLIGTGELPVKMAGDSGNGVVDDFPVLELGESVTVEGYTITVTADDGDTHTVSITRTG